MMRRKAQLDTQAETLLASYSAPKFWWDFSRADCRFQDPLGTALTTTANQTVGLLLDRATGRSRGAELVAQPIALTNTTVWPSVAAVSSRTASTVTTSGAGGINFTGLTVGKFYELLINATSTVSASVYNSNTTANLLTAINGAASVRFTAATTNLYLRTTAAGTITVNALSVKEVPGYHLIQPNAANRPLFKTDSGMQFGAFEGTSSNGMQSHKNFDGASATKMTLIAALRKRSDTDTGIMLEYPHDFTSGGGFAFYHQNDNPPAIYFGMGGVNNQVLHLDSTQPDLLLLTGVANLTSGANPSGSLSKNGVLVGTGTDDLGGGTVATGLVNVGRRNNADIPGTFDLMSLIGVGALLSTADIQLLQRASAAKTTLVIA